MKGIFLDRLPSLRFGTLRLRIAVLFTILFALVMSVVMILLSGVSGETSSSRRNDTTPTR